jgi:hypothetical protein
MNLNLQLSMRGGGKLCLASRSHPGFGWAMRLCGAENSHEYAILAQLLIAAILCHYRRGKTRSVQREWLEAPTGARAQLRKINTKTKRAPHSLGAPAVISAEYQISTANSNIRR